METAMVTALSVCLCAAAMMGVIWTVDAEIMEQERSSDD